MQIEITDCISGPPYLPEIWHYRRVNTGFIRSTIKEFNCERAFSNTSVNEKVDIFHRTTLNILSNYIPHEIIVCDDKDAPWPAFTCSKLKVETLGQGV